ncbi:MAG: hypothetical protein ABSC00_10475 [Acidimicrobiales bacterium]|jgi:hypothetical protein
MSNEPLTSDEEPTQQFPEGLQTKATLNEDSVAVEDLLSRPAETDDLEMMLKVRPPRRKLPLLTMLLACAVLAGAGVAGGVEIQKHLGSSSTSSLGALAAALRGRGTSSGSSSGAFGRGGAFLGGGGSTGETVGTVLLVDGSTIYVTTSGGGVVKVDTTPSTSFEVTEAGSVSDLKPGSTVIVTGSGSSGTITARSVSQSSVSNSG